MTDNFKDNYIQIQAQALSLFEFREKLHNELKQVETRLSELLSLKAQLEKIEADKVNSPENTESSENSESLNTSVASKTKDAKKEK